MWVCVLSVICPTTVWAGTLGYTAGSALSPPPPPAPHTQAHTHPRTNTCTQTTRTSESVFYLGTWVELPRPDSSQNPAHTHIHTSERRGTTLLTGPVSTAPKSSNIAHSLCSPVYLAAVLRKRMKLQSTAPTVQVRADGRCTAPQLHTQKGWMSNPK